jgi:hypothetical protein
MIKGSVCALFHGSRMDRVWEETPEKDEKVLFQRSSESPDMFLMHTLLSLGSYQDSCCIQVVDQLWIVNTALLETKTTHNLS